jgi:N-acetyl-gamma-glutamyl-phosphate reductase
LIVVSAIDNLLKGAASQAVQNMNIRFGIEEKMGIDMIPGYPI